MRVILVSLFVIFASANVHSQQIPAAQTALDEYLKAEQRRFQPYEPNYVLWQVTEEDNKALEAHYSFKYQFTRPDCSDRNLDENESFSQCSREFLTRWETYFKFTGEFDFYLGTRSSSPVVNRRSNPAIHWRQYLNDRNLFNFATWKYIDFGVQHFSNGQSTDAENGCDPGPCEAQQVFLSARKNDAFFDGISRGVNYLSVEASFRIGPNRDDKDPISGRCSGTKGGCYDLWVRAIPWYITDDNLITWDRNLNTRHVAGFDLLRVIASRKKLLKPRGWTGMGFTEFETSIKWTLGDDGFATDSFDLGISLPWQNGPRFKLPFFLEIHHGPLNNLSDYARDQNSVGLGLRFY